jgi:hypothetical protein
MLKNKCMDFVPDWAVDHCKKLLNDLLISKDFKFSLNALAQLEKEFTNEPVMAEYFHALTTSIYMDEQEKNVNSIVDKLSLLKVQLNAQRVPPHDNINHQLLASVVTTINQMLAMVVTPLFTNNLGHELRQLQQAFSSGKVLDRVVLYSIYESLVVDLRHFTAIRESLALHH